MGCAVAGSAKTLQVIHARLARFIEAGERNSVVNLEAAGGDVRTEQAYIALFTALADQAAIIADHFGALIAGCAGAAAPLNPQMAPIRLSPSI